jgi:hypothetical protein
MKNRPPMVFSVMLPLTIGQSSKVPFISRVLKTVLPRREHLTNIPQPSPQAQVNLTFYFQNNRFSNSSISTSPDLADYSSTLTNKDSTKNIIALNKVILMYAMNIVVAIALQLHGFGIEREERFKWPTVSIIEHDYYNAKFIFFRADCGRVG